MLQAVLAQLEDADGPRRRHHAQLALFFLATRRHAAHRQSVSLRQPLHQEASHLHLRVFEFSLFSLGSDRFVEARVELAEGVLVQTRVCRQLCPAGLDLALLGQPLDIADA